MMDAHATTINNTNNNVNANIHTNTKNNMCDNGSLVPEQSIPGAYASDCMYLPSRTLTLQSQIQTNNKSIQIITVSQGTTGNSNNRSVTTTGRTGVAVWNSCLLLTRMLDALNVSQSQSQSQSQTMNLLNNNNDHNNALFRNRVVLELGAGTGLASIAAYKMGAKRVIATDGNEEVVDLARRNIAQNMNIDDGRANNSNSCITAKQLKWGVLDAMDYANTADFIIGSDLTYNSGTWKILAETVATILKQPQPRAIHKNNDNSDGSGTFLYLTLGHSGFSAVGEVAGFVSVAEGEGLYVVKEGSSEWPFAGTTATLKELLLEKCIRGPEEREVLSGTGGVQVLVMKMKRRSY